MRRLSALHLACDEIALSVSVTHSSSDDPSIFAVMAPGPQEINGSLPHFCGPLG
jgi:hypothetical protein